MAADLGAEHADERGERVEGTLGLHAGDAGDLVEQFVNSRAASAERGAHVSDRVEVTGDRRERGPLRHVRDV